MYRSPRLRRKALGRWLVLILGVAAVVSLAVAVNVGSVRAALLAKLGTERRNQVIAFTSSLNPQKVNTDDMVPMRYTGINPLGVNTFLEQEADVNKRRETLQMIKDAGIGWIRQQFPWEDIEEPAKGEFWDTKYNQSSWAKFDNIVNLANQYGIQMIVRLDTSPRWAHPNNPWPSTPPDNLNDYGDFVYQVVSRYKGKVKYYQLWNEPNLSSEWGNKPVDARAYVKLLKIGYERAKEADPNCVILSAGLAPTIEQSWRAMDDQIYLQQMYDAGAKNYFDILSVQAYGLRSGPDDQRLTLNDVNFSRPLLDRQIMVKNGDAAKPIWVSEMGWNAQPDSVKAAPVFGRVSERLQAQYTVRAFQRAAEQWPWMGVMNIWFFKRVDDHEKNQPFYYFRMVGPDFAIHPIYNAVKAFGTQPPAIHRGYFQEDDWVLKYQGNWKEVSDPQACLGGMKETRAAGNTISGTFDGTDLTLVVPKGPSYGPAYVEIDGTPQAANQLPRDGSGRAILNEKAASPAWQQEIPVASGLANGRHQFKITTMGAFALDGEIVNAPTPVSPLQTARHYLPYLLAIMVVGLVGALMMFRARVRRQARVKFQ